jgi:hypothetical protein
MDACRLGLAAIAILTLLIALKPEPARAVAALAVTSHSAGVAASPLISAHFRKTQSYYCYPRNYWWFYRPYTTAEDGHARCMPYFHYPPYEGQGRSENYLK